MNDPTPLVEDRAPAEVAAEDTAFAVERVRTYTLVAALGAGAAFVLGAVVALTQIDTWQSLVFLAAVAVHGLTMVWCRRSVSEDTIVQTVVVATVANWVLALVLAPLVSWALPILLFPVLITLLNVVQTVEPDEVRRWIAGGAATVTVVAILALTVESEIDRQMPAGLADGIVVFGVAAFTVPLSLAAWDGFVRLQVSLERLHEANEALRTSRARVVEAGDAERQRVEQNLHDGAQQRLLGLLIAVRALGRRHPDATDAADALAEEVEATIAEVRDLAHGLYPPLLETEGLVPALVAAARRAAVPVQVRAGESSTTAVGRLDRAVESTVYFVVLEALQNAVKYAGPDARVVVEVDVADGLLHVVVRDDGAGFDEAATGRGRGLVHMADRIGAVDGTLLVDAAPGAGTTVTARVPISAVRFAH